MNIEDHPVLTELRFMRGIKNHFPESRNLDEEAFNYTEWCAALAMMNLLWRHPATGHWMFMPEGEIVL